MSLLPRYLTVHKSVTADFSMDLGVVRVEKVPVLMNMRSFTATFIRVPLVDYRPHLLSAESDNEKGAHVFV